jgi:hypothetical protein
MFPKLTKRKAEVPQKARKKPATVSSVEKNCRDNAAASRTETSVVSPFVPTIPVPTAPSNINNNSIKNAKETSNVKPMVEDETQ